jgi:hypothetical protein
LSLPTVRDRFAAALPVVFACGGAALLFVQWRWGRMLWLDEEMIAINIRDRTLRELAGSLSLGQAAPYGWLVLERAMVLAFGPAERALRAVPVAFGMATIGAALWIGRRWMTTAGASLLVLLCVFGQWVSFYALELKHYSADVCFALLLPALALRAIEKDRPAAWWTVAAAAQWFANGALFVAPACALVLIVSAWRRHGRRAAGFAAAPALLWLVSFAVNYQVTLGPARGSEFLRGFWSTAFPPEGAGPGGVISWLASQLDDVAVKPVGGGFGAWFWIVPLAGFAFAPRYPPEFRVLFALIPLSAFVWASARLVPLFERLSLWIVPSLYVGVALFAEWAVDLVGRARIRRSWPLAAAAAVAAVAAAILVADVVQRGTIYLRVTPPAANHALDDRGAVRWLARQRQPGDAWITTHNALPSIWWYAGPEAIAPLVEAQFHSEPDACGSEEIGAWLARTGASRALVYFGFGHDVPAEFDDVLAGRLAALGRVAGYRLFGEDSHALIVDLRQPGGDAVTLDALAGDPKALGRRPPPGCIAIQPARRW